MFIIIIFVNYLAYLADFSFKMTVEGEEGHIICQHNI